MATSVHPQVRYRRKLKQIINRPRVSKTTIMVHTASYCKKSPTLALISATTSKSKHHALDLEVFFSEMRRHGVCKSKVVLTQKQCSRLAVITFIRPWKNGTLVNNFRRIIPTSATISTKSTTTFSQKVSEIHSI